MRRLVPVLLAACGASSSSPRDAGQPDAAPLDASAATLDAAPFDAGSAPDAASPDAALDASLPLDAAPPDAGCCEDDGISCTREVCGADGACEHVADDLLCALDACQIGRCDPDAGCVGEPVDDGVPCGESAFGGPPPKCFSGICVPGRVVGMELLDLWIRSPVPMVVPNVFDCLLRLSDVDGDGRVDVTASEREEPGVASLIAIDGTDGSELWRVSEAASGFFGVVPAGDRDGDGTPDVFATHHTESPDSIEQFLEIRSGSDGAVVQSWTWENELQAGFSAIADLDGDGLDDLLMRSSAVVIVDGQPRAGDERSYSLVSSVSLDVIGAVEPPGVGGFCWRVGDLNGDATDEITFLEYQTDWDNPVPIDLWAIDLTTGETLWSRSTEDQSCPIATYDLDGEGGRDLIDRPGQLGALSGSDGTVLLQDLFPADWHAWPRDALQVGDLNGDGAEDWACGAGVTWIDGNELDQVLGIWFFASVVEY